MTILEAMACGRAAVAYKWGGPAYLVEHGHGGLLVPPERGSAGLASALHELLADRQRLLDMGTYNRDRVETQFSWERIVWKIEDVYRSLLHADASFDTTGSRRR